LTALVSLVNSWGGQGDPAENPVGVFPRENSLTLVVDRSCLSSNFMGWTGTAVTSPLLGKRTDDYN